MSSLLYLLGSVVTVEGLKRCNIVNFFPVREIDAVWFPYLVIDLIIDVEKNLNNSLRCYLGRYVVVMNSFN